METSEMKSLLAPLASSLDVLIDRMNDADQKFNGFQKQVDTIELNSKERLTGGPLKSGEMRKSIEESDSLQRLLKDRRGTAVIQFKEKAMSEFMRARRRSLKRDWASRRQASCRLIASRESRPKRDSNFLFATCSRHAPTNNGCVDFVKVRVAVSALDCFACS